MAGSTGREAAADAALDLGRIAHPDCVVCGPSNRRGLKLQYRRCADGSVETDFACESCYTGFPGIVHGGVVAMLLDGAMTHCLFAHGHRGLTAELSIRYRAPVETNRRATVRAVLVKSARRLCVLSAEIVQNGTVKAVARAKFMNQHAHTVMGARADGVADKT